MNVPTGYTALDMVGFTDKGTYNSATAYVKNDIAHYGGNLWRCLVDDTTGVTPAEGVNWTVFLDEPTSAAEDIIAQVEATSTAAHSYAVGKQLIYNDTLYTVTSAITVGDTLTVGTNITASDSIVDQLDTKANSSDLATVATTGAYFDLSGKPTLGTAAEKNVPASGDASTTEVVMGDDTRLSNARNAADVSAWAKAANKPTYNGAEIETNTAKTGTAQLSISDTVASGTSMDNVVGTMLNNDKTLDTNVSSLNEAFRELTESKADKDGLLNIVQTGTTATQFIPAKTFFYLNGQLVYSKIPIANGATFTLGTNYEVPTAGALNNLSSRITNEITHQFKYLTSGSSWTRWVPHGAYLVSCFYNGGGSKYSLDFVMVRSTTCDVVRLAASGTAPNISISCSNRTLTITNNDTSYTGLSFAILAISDTADNIWID